MERALEDLNLNLNADGNSSLDRTSDNAPSENNPPVRQSCQVETTVTTALKHRVQQARERRRRCIDSMHAGAGARAGTDKDIDMGDGHPIRWTTYNHPPAPPGVMKRRLAQARVKRNLKENDTDVLDATKYLLGDSEKPVNGSDMYTSTSGLVGHSHWLNQVHDHARAQAQTSAHAHNHAHTHYHDHNHAYGQDGSNKQNERH
ncbi:hypothetical protein BDV18DRAFT_142934 [Aspergillus unguis]